VFDVGTVHIYVEPHCGFRGLLTLNHLWSDRHDGFFQGCFPLKRRKIMPPDLSFLYKKRNKCC